MKPTMYELAQPKMNKKAVVALKRAMRDAQKSQEKLLKQAAQLGKRA